jgi:hypothetical protein
MARVELNEVTKVLRGVSSSWAGGRSRHAHFCDVASTEAIAVRPEIAPAGAVSQAICI